jgi:hypothetical protein
LATAAAGTPPDELLLVPPRTLPKTSNGKLRRATVRRMYFEGRVGERPASPWVQMAGLWLRNLPALTVRGIKKGSAACVRGLIRAAAFSIGVAGGCAARVPGCRSVIGPAARASLGILGKTPRLEGQAPKGAAVVAANRCGHLDPLSLIALMPGRAALCGDDALLGLRGWAAFLARPAVIAREAAANALKRGETVLLMPDGPVGAPASRCRFRLDALQAAMGANAPVAAAAVLEVRGRTVVRIEQAAVTECEDARTLRGRVRESIARLFSE